MNIRPPTDGAIDEAVARLRAGELIGLPTETVYGLAGDASNIHAVAKIFAIKGRPATHPVIVHLASTDAVHEWASDIPSDAGKLLAAFAPGPLTLILRRSARVLDVVTGGQDTVGLRFPSHPVARRVLDAFGGGIAAPSANRFGRISATAAGHVVEEFEGRAAGVLELVLDGGPCEVGIESTIVDVSGLASGPGGHRGDGGSSGHDGHASRSGSRVDGPRATLLRPGAITASDLEQVLGYRPAVRGQASPRVSGDLPSHYAPQTPTRRVGAARLIVEAMTSSASRVAVLARTIERPPDFPGIWRDVPADATGYGRALYAELRVLDASQVDLILVESPPDQAEWQAVNDRLRRAAHDTESRGA